MPAMAFTLSAMRLEFDEDERHLVTMNLLSCTSTELLRCGHSSIKWDCMILVKPRDVGKRTLFPQRIGFAQVVGRTILSDIPQCANPSVATARKLRRFLSIISGIAPFKPSLTPLAGQIQVSRNSAECYLGYREKAGMIASLQVGSRGINALGKPEKICLGNTSHLYRLGESAVDVGTVREAFFFNQMRVRHRVTASRIADFEIEGITFEAAGRGKTSEQLREAKDGSPAKDDIEYGHGRTIPLWAFGLIY